MRFVTSRETLEKRLSQRVSGELLCEHLTEVDEMYRIMDELQLEHATAVTDGVSVEEVARQVVVTAFYTEN